MIYVTNNDNSQRSKPHRRVERILDEMGITYISEYPLSPYTVDIFLTEWKLAVEVDGPLHNQKKDAVRDKWILEYHGVPTLRISARKWHTTLYIKSKITTFIEQNA